MIRAVQAAGGFATVLNRGERGSGTILVVLAEKSANARLFERVPDAQGGRIWTATRIQDIEKPLEFSDYLDRRCMSDPDLWIIELDIADGERFIGIRDDAG
jgi:hypothetical protein